MIWFIILMVVFAFVLILQIAKASEYVSILKGEKKAQEQSNKINAFLMLIFLVLGLIGVWYCHQQLIPKYEPASKSHSVEGVEIDKMLMMTLWITGSVCLVTQVLLFYFSWKFQYKEDRKVYFFSHSTKLEIIWTSIPAVAMTVLVVFGLIHWFKVTGDAPKGSMQWEITGKQFGWIYRHPGADSVFGKKDRYKITNNNSVGVDFQDKYALDDIIVADAIHCVKGIPVELIINSRDVIHDVGSVHFRIKMDAVPGLPTSQWFTPKYSTREAKEKYGNSFEYEISCDQMCGSGHYSMKGLITVHDNKQEYDAWLVMQKSLYASENEAKNPQAAQIMPTNDTMLKKPVDTAKAKAVKAEDKKITLALNK
jgi:cytochrome c oxidase subunit II